MRNENRQPWWLDYADRMGRLFGGMAVAVVISGVWSGNFSQLLAGIAILAVAVVAINLEFNGHKSSLNKLTQRSLMLYPFGSSLMAGGYGGERFEPILFWPGVVALVIGVGMTIWDEVLRHRRHKAESNRRLWGMS